MDRVDRERHFHDEQAAARATSWSVDPQQLRFQDDEFLDHETWVRPAWNRLGPLNGRRFLDYGCGHGMAAVVAARQGAVVTAMDLSHAYLRETAERAKVNGVRVECIQADAHVLPFADASFDAIWGHAVLHHLDLHRAGRELRRVMRRGGVAVFCEPWGGNPWLEFARKYLPYPGKDRTADEQPLGRRDLAVLREIFPTLRWDGHQLVAMIGRALPLRRGIRSLARCDGWCLSLCPPLKNLARYVVISLTHD